jgi:hypothetical protein
VERVVIDPAVLVSTPSLPGATRPDSGRRWWAGIPRSRHVPGSSPSWLPCSSGPGSGGTRPLKEARSFVAEVARRGHRVADPTDVPAVGRDQNDDYLFVPHARHRFPRRDQRRPRPDGPGRASSARSEPSERRRDTDLGWPQRLSTRPVVRDSCANDSKSAVSRRNRADEKLLLRPNFSSRHQAGKLPFSAFGTLRPRVQIPPSRPGQRG